MHARLREPFGKAGLTVAVIALVFAMLGGAYAAGKLTSTQKKEVEKIAKKFQGTGPQGPAGQDGAKGDTGQNGAKGDTGQNGAKGDSGVNGVSPTGTSFSGAQGGCTEGGVKFTGANTTYACNGAKGATGFTETLPQGETETGTWGFSPKGAELGFIGMPLNIPLPEELGAVSTSIVFNAPGTTDCPGTIAAPEAAPGKFCIYAEGSIYDAATNPTGTKYRPVSTKLFTSGAVVTFNGQEAGALIEGTYAATPKVPGP